MKLIVGLGNIGSEYVATRHNIGFMVVERLAQQHGVRLAQRWSQDSRVVACYGETALGKTAVRLMVPQTMMNHSGEALGTVAAWGVGLPDLLLVCDDVNLPLGTLRLRAQGSDGGHHGLASCLGYLQTEAVSRLRIGIGISSLPNDLTEFVLSPFEAVEQPVVHQAVTRAVEACELWVREGIQVAMNEVNPMTTE